MRLVATDSAPEGATLARDVILDPANPIPFARYGMRLNDSSKRALLRSGVRRVYVDDDLGEGIEIVESLTDSTRKDATDRVAKALGAGRKRMQFGGTIDGQFVDELQSVATLIAKEVTGFANVARVFTDLSGADQYLLQHSVDVCALGVAIGARYLRDHGWKDGTGRQRCDANEAMLTKLGLGLLLHDLGKTAIPRNVLDKPGKLDADEWKVMQSHPEVGESMLPYEMSFVVKAIVRSHHERWDGRGYPDGLAGTDIELFARVAAAADIFDAITSERVYKPASPSHVGYFAVTELGGTALDPNVVSVFGKVVAPYPPGTEVVLADGRSGVVSLVDMDDPLQPVVRVRTGTRFEVVERCPVVGTPESLEQRRAA